MATIADMQKYNMLQKIGPMNEGLAMAHPPGQLPPYVPPDKPSSPYEPGKSPAPSRDDKIVMEPDDISEFDVTDKGLYMHYSGDMFMNLDGMLFPMGQGYEEKTHGKFVPKGLVQSMQINPEIARNFTYDAEPGGVVTPRYFTPPKMRDYFRTPGIQEKELFHFNNFIRSLGPGFDKVQRRTPMSIG